MVDSDLIGRAADLAALREALAEGGAVALVGPAGVGKSRLVRALVGAPAPHLDAACVVDSERADAIGAACAAIAQGLDFSLGAAASDGEAVARVGDALAARGRVLLALDHGEALVEALGAAVRAWTDANAELSVLVSGRRRLGLAQERLVELAPLAPEAARALFVRRAGRVVRGYDPGGAEREVIDALVEELDRLPLAIELAAARVRVLDPAALRARLSRRFEALGAGPRDAPRRHAGLRAAIDASFELLDAPARRAFAQSSVFEGGFTLDAAEAVLELDGAPVLDVVEALVEHSLLGTERGPGGVRYAALASVRAYAAEQLEALGEGDAARARHAAWFLSRGLAAADWVERGPAPRARAWLTREAGNLLAIHRRGLAPGGAPSDALDAALALQPVWIDRGPESLRETKLDAALRAHREGDPFRVGWARLARGDARQRLGRLDDAEADLRRAVELAAESGDPRLGAAAWWRLGALRSARGHASEADAAFEEALRRYREAGDRFHEGRCLASIGAHALAAGRIEDARAALEAAAALHEASGDAVYGAATEGQRGGARARRGRARQGEGPDSIRALTTLRALEHRRWRGSLLARRAAVALEEEAVPDALALLDEAEHELERGGDPALAAELAALLERARAARDGGWVVGPEARWLKTPAGERIDLSRRRAPRLVLAALLDAAADPHRRLDVDELFAAGWPGEKALPKAAAGRVYAALSTLRRLGLEPLIVRDDAGWRIDSDALERSSKIEVALPAPGVSTDLSVGAEHHLEDAVAVGLDPRRPHPRDATERLPIGRPVRGDLHQRPVVADHVGGHAPVLRHLEARLAQALEERLVHVRRRGALGLGARRAGPLEPRLPRRPAVSGRQEHADRLIALHGGDPRLGEVRHRVAARGDVHEARR